VPLEPKIIKRSFLRQKVRFTVVALYHHEAPQTKGVFLIATCHEAPISETLARRLRFERAEVLRKEKGVRGREREARGGRQRGLAPRTRGFISTGLKQRRWFGCVTTNIQEGLPHRNGILCLFRLLLGVSSRNRSFLFLFSELNREIVPFSFFFSEKPFLEKDKR